VTNRDGQNRREVAREREPHQEVPLIPKQVGPCRFGRLGFWITVQCPEYDDLMLSAGALWEPRERRWLAAPAAHLGPVLRKLRRQTDPLFRRAGLDLVAAQ
jgi:hypothetical protein